MFRCNYCLNVAMWECRNDKFCSNHLECHKNIHFKTQHKFQDIYCKLSLKHQVEVDAELNRRLKVLKTCKSSLTQSAMKIIIENHPSRDIILQVQQLLNVRVRNIDKLTKKYVDLIITDEYSEGDLEELEKIMQTRLIFRPLKEFTGYIDEYFNQEMIEIFDEEKQWKLFFQNNSSECSCSALTDDESFLVAGYADSSIKTWDLQSKNIITVLLGHTECVTSVCVSEDNQIIASGSYDKTVCVWSAQAGKLTNKFHGHKYLIISVKLANENANVVSASMDKSIKVWDIKRGVLYISFEDSFHVTSISIFYEKVTSGNNKGLIKMWDLSSGRQDMVLRKETENSPVVRTVIIKERRLLIAGYVSGMIIVWNLVLNTELTTLTGHLLSITCLDVRNNTLVSGSSDRTVRFWSLDTFQFKSSAFITFAEVIHEVQFTKDQKIIVSQNTIQLYNQQQNAIEYFLPMNNYFNIKAFFKSLDKKYVAYSDRSYIYIWNLIEGNIRCRVKATSAFCLALSEDSNLLVFGYTYVGIFIIHENHYFELNGHRGMVVCVAVTFDNKLVVSGAQDQTIRLWSLKDKKHTEINTNGSPTGLGITHNKKFIVYGSTDLNIRVFSIFNNTHLQIMFPIQFEIYRITFAKDDKSAKTNSLNEILEFSFDKHMNMSEKLRII